MMPKKSPVSHTVPTCLTPDLPNTEKRPCREYRCGTDQRPSEGSVRREFQQY